MSFRFGLLSAEAEPGRVLRDAEKAEVAGFDIFQLGDHLGTGVSPLVALTAAAGATEHIRLGTLVLNNDLRHPVVLAQEVATLDQASGGRLEVGIGAGHSFTEYDAAGIPFDPPAVRKERLAESVVILRALLSGSPVSVQGRHYTLDNVRVLPSAQERVPMLVGVNGRTALAHAVQHADVVAPTMLGRTLPDGQHHEVRWEAARLDDTVAWIQDVSASQGRPVALHALVQAVIVTDDRTRVAEEIAQKFAMALSDVLTTPFLCVGTHEEIADHLIACRHRWNIEYYTVRSIHEFEPVMRHLRELDRSNPYTPDR
jgi:probable F420-dependent oxidoreductase